MIELSLKYDFENKNQEATLRIDSDTIDKVFLSVAHRTARNRTALYQRKHPILGTTSQGPVKLKTSERDPELAALNQPIPEHYQLLWELHGPFADRPVISFAISDLTANLLRPHYDFLIRPEKRAFQLGQEADRAIYRDGSDACLFYLEDEPIGKVPYTLLFSYEEEGQARFAICHKVTVQRDGSLPSDQIPEVIRKGLKWWAACPPLLINGKHNLEQFAILDYDLRHVFGFSGKVSEMIREMYQSFSDWGKWCETIRQKLHNAELPKIACHAALGISEKRELFVIHRNATIPKLAEELEKLGAQEAVLLDSGGSCALWANWANGDQGGILSNQQGYFRPARGAVVFLVLKGECRGISLSK